MTIRTDVVFRNGRVEPVTPNADSREELPKVQLSDRLASDAWGTSILNKADKVANDSTLNAATRAHTEFVRDFKNLVEARNTQPDSETQAKHLEAVARHYDGLIKRSEVKFSRLRSNDIPNALRNMDKQFRERLKFDGRNATQIQQALFNMNEEERSKWVNQAIERGDGQFLAAVLDGHPASMRLSYEQVEAYRDRALLKHAPDLKQLENALKQTDELLFDTFNDALMLGDAVTAAQIRQKHREKSLKAMEARKKAGFYS